MTPITHIIPRAELDTRHAELSRVLADAGIARSGYEGAMMIVYGLVSVNGKRTLDEDRRLSEDDLDEETREINIRVGDHQRLAVKVV